jgi:glycosyltransferase involved in cell wall biosynthesis
MSTSNRLKVLHAVLSLDCGGLEQIVLQMCRFSVARGEQPEVLCLERPGTLSEALRADGVQVHCISKPPGLNVNWTRRTIAHVLKSTKPDIIHTHQIGVLLHVGIAAYQLGVPVVHSEHGKHFDNSFRHRWLGRIAGRLSKRFVCVSSDIAESVRRWHIAPPKRLRVVQNGIDVGHFANSDGREEIGPV